MLSPITTSDMSIAVKDLRRLADMLEGYLEKVDAAKMQHVYLHWFKFRDTTLPDLENYIEGIGPTISAQIRAAAEGRANPYEKSKERADKDPRTRAGKLNLEKKKTARKKKGV